MGRINKINYFFSFLFDCISFNGSRAIVFNIAAIVTFFVLTPSHFFEIMPSPCIFRNYILPLIYRNKCPESGLFVRCECPACGLTRATSRFFHGDIKGAISYNRLVIIIVLTIFSVLIYHLMAIFKNKK